MAKTDEQKPEWAPLPRLTVSNIGGKPRRVSESNKQAYVGRIFGECNGMKVKEIKSTGDLMTIFVGEFRAINYDNEKFECNRMSLPASIGEALEGAITVSDGKPVRFAFDLYAVYSDKSPVGYTYAVKSLVETEASSRLVEMTAQLMKTKALPAAKG